MDPATLIQNQLEMLFKIILKASQSKTEGTKEASYRAITTLAFVLPDVVLPRVVDQLKVDVATDIKTLTDEDFGMWTTPEGEPYIDGMLFVLSRPSCHIILNL